MGIEVITKVQDVNGIISLIPRGRFFDCIIDVKVPCPCIKGRFTLETSDHDRCFLNSLFGSEMSDGLTLFYARSPALEMYVFKKGV